MAYNLSTYAERDIENILTYTIETWGIRQFQKYRDLINHSLDLIGNNPDALTVRKREELFEGGNSYSFGKHVVFFRVKNDIIEIVRILHQKMDVESHIPEEY